MMKMQGIRALLDNVVNSRNLVEMTQSRNLLTSCIENYANQRVIEELEWVLEDTISQGATMIQIAVTERIKELKQK